MPASKTLLRWVREDYLSPKRAAFVEEYVNNGFNATAAAKSVGYAPRAAQAVGAKLTHLPKVRHAIATVLEERGATKERVVSEYMRIAFDETEKTENRLKALDRLAQFTQAIDPKAIATTNVLAIGDSAVAGLLQAIQARRPVLPAGEVIEADFEVVPDPPKSPETVEFEQDQAKTASQDDPGTKISDAPIPG